MLLCHKHSHTCAESFDVVPGEKNGTFDKRGIHYLAKVRVFFGLAKPHQKKRRKSRPHHHHHPKMPRTRACTPAQHEQVKALLDNGVPAKKIGALVRPPIGYSTVLKMQENFQNFGMTKTPHLLTIGRPAKITPEMGQVVVPHILY